MNTTRSTIHMMLACYLSDDPENQVIKMAKRTQKRTISKRTKKAMQYVIDSPRPVELVKGVYSDSFD